MLQEAPKRVESSSSVTVVCGVKVKQKACVELAASQNLQLSKQKQKEIVIQLESDSETKTYVIAGAQNIFSFKVGHFNPLSSKYQIAFLNLFCNFDCKMRGAI